MANPSFRMTVFGWTIGGMISMNIVGCTLQLPVNQPDDSAIVAVVASLYAPEESTVPLFLGGLGDGPAESFFDTARGRLATELGAPVHALSEIEFDEQTGGFPARVGATGDEAVTIMAKRRVRTPACR